MMITRNGGVITNVTPTNNQRLRRIVRIGVDALLIIRS